MLIKDIHPQCVQRVYLKVFQGNNKGYPTTVCSEGILEGIVRVFQCVDKGHSATVCSEGILEGVPG